MYIESCILVKTNILQKLTIFLFQRMADKLYGIHKIHGNYGRVFNELSGIEKEMAEPLQSASHYMNV